MNKQKVSCNISIDSLDSCSGNIFLPPGQCYQLTINYPLETQYNIFIETTKNGMGLSQLLFEIGKAYKRIYESPKRYGVYGHSINDLYLEGIDVDHDKQIITLSVGS